MKLHPEVRWAVLNYLLLNLFCFVAGAALGAILLASSADATIPGYGGSPPEQILWYAVGVVFFLPMVLGIPVLAVALVAWRLAIRVSGHPRATAYIVATAMVIAAALLIDRTEPFYFLIVLGLALGFATIVRLPPSQGLSSEPQPTSSASPSVR